jgi:uncharacterized protein with PIN domain
VITTVVTPVQERTCYVLDACALIAYLNDEPGAEIVEELLMLARTSQVDSLECPNPPMMVVSL